MNNKKNELKQINKPKSSDLSVLSLLIFAFLVVSLGVALFASLAVPWKKINPGSFFVKPPAISEKDGAIKKFKNYEELKDFLSKGVNDVSNLYGMGLYGMDGFALTDGIARKEASDNIETWGVVNKPSGVPMKSEIGSGDYSTTNIQVAGVDEGDIIKTDGEYIYAVSGNEVSIAKAYPAENAKIVSTIKFDSAPNGIYVSGNKLAVYGADWTMANKYSEDSIMKRRNYSYTYLKIFDISDKSNPKEERTLDFEGSHTNSRMIGNYVYFVTAASPYYYAFNEEIPIPFIIENEKIITVDPNGSTDKICAKCVSPDVYYFDIPYHSYNFTSVNAINIADSGEKINSEVYVLDGNQNSMFVSKNNIYITFAKYVSEEELTMDVVMEMIKEKIYPRLNAKDMEMVSEIEKTENYILSPQEKFTKIGMIFRKYANLFSESEEGKFQKELEEKIKQKYEDISKELEKTMIHKIAINGKSLKYESFGEVPGIVLNQFSMDEDGGYFRIATTKNRTWSSFVDADQRESYNNLYVLDGNMKVVGKVEELAKGERIYSVRFMQNRAYMVTFKQTDPLFVIDLSSPTNPKVLGKLKVPGFSSYLHPYDETTLIGLGKETDDSGRITGGVKLSLFDVADVENPKELDKYVLGDTSSSSIAIDNHKAFLFSKDKNLLVIPVNKQNATAGIDGISFEEDERLKIMPIKKFFNGAAVFSIDKFRFNFRGKINHSNANYINQYDWYDYNKAVKRSLYIKDTLYTFSDKYIKANRLADLEEINVLKLNAGEPGPIPKPMPRPMNLPE